MKKQILLLILSAIIICSNASALSTNIKSAYGSQETMIIKVGGNIAETINPDQISFKRGNIFVPIEYDTARVGDYWYIWAIAPEAKGNYTFIMDNVAVINNGVNKKESYQSNFEVVSNLTGYDVKPGFLVTSKPFSITANVLDDDDKEISAGFNGEQVVILKPGANKIDFSISKINNTGLYYLQVGKYSLPVYVTIAGSTPIPEGSMPSNQTQNSTINNSTNSTIVTNTTNSSATNLTVSIDSDELSIEPYYIQRLLYADAKSSTYSFVLTNPTSTTYKDLKISFNKTLFDIEPDDEVTLKSNESYEFNITLGKYSGDEIREKILINGTNVSLEIPFFVRYTQNASDVAVFYGESGKNSSANATRKTTLLCSELGGVVCSTKTTCKGESLDSREGSCCLGICTAPSNSGSKAWIGWLIAFAALGGLWFLYMKYKKAAPAPAPAASTSGIDLGLPSSKDLGSGLPGNIPGP